MREKDTVTKSYLSDPERFAQLFNTAMFHGNPILDPKKLKDFNPTESVSLSPKTPHSNNQQCSKELYRDILKQYEDRAILILCGIENQTNIHYAMPVRHMLYDALQYHKQWQIQKQIHTKEKDLTGDSFLSGFSKDDRLIPVFTLCVYWGSKPWDGPKNLQEMLDIPPELEQYKSMITNYTLNILEVNFISNLDDYHGELKALLGLLRYQKDKAGLQTFVNNNRELFQSISPETVLAMSVLGNMKALEQYLPNDHLNDDNFSKEQGGIDMCQAIEEMIQDGEKRGEKRGGIQTLIEDNLEEGISKTRILEKLQRRFGLTNEEALAAFASVVLPKQSV